MIYRPGTHPWGYHVFSSTYWTRRGAGTLAKSWLSRQSVGNVSRTLSYRARYYLPCLHEATYAVLSR